MRHTLIIPVETRTRLAEYLTLLQANITSAGKRLRDHRAGTELAALTDSKFLDALLNTKPPRIFAESAVAGDGPDWSLTELGILGGR